MVLTEPSTALQAYSFFIGLRLTDLSMGFRVEGLGLYIYNIYVYR